jgi:hypothetical protein
MCSHSWMLSGLDAREGRPVTRYLILALLIFAPVFLPFSQANASFPAKECNEQEVRDYSYFPRGMRPVHRPPYATRGLPFGAPGLEILSMAPAKVLTRSGKVGFYLRASAESVGGPGWLVESRLSVVDRRGRHQRTLRRRVRTVYKTAKPAAVNLDFKVGGKLGFYRVDIEVYSLAGKGLVSYQDYFRVAKLIVDVRLGLDRDAYRADRNVLLRLENYGTVGVVYGYEFALEVFDGAAWRISPTGIAGWPQPAFGLGLGRAQPCQRFALPSELSPGRYRLIKKYSTTMGASMHPARAAFDVLP